jgi:biotin-dependent carboxylase-like uncharacterized protein
MSLEILTPGLLTSVQDAGRSGWRASGVGVGGAADGWSLRIANLLVGNQLDAAVLEITLNGPTLRLHRAATIALCGAQIDALVDGLALPGWRPIALPAGSILTLGACRRGARACLAIDGGIDVALVLGSRSTDLRAGFGGHEGRALRAADVLPLAGASPRLRDVSERAASQPNDAPRIASWWIDADTDLDFSDSIAVRVLPGNAILDVPDALYAQEFVVDAASNRQGLRLRGTALQIADTRERISEPVVPGTVQLPPDGQPIVLLADAQTVGGYPRIGHVIAADLPRLAQRRAGQHLRFLPIDAHEAHRINVEQRVRLGRIALAIADRR